jgi:hypothetical protein
MSCTALTLGIMVGAVSSVWTEAATDELHIPTWRHAASREPGDHQLVVAIVELVLSTRCQPLPRAGFVVHTLVYPPL